MRTPHAELLHTQVDRYAAEEIRAELGRQNVSQLQLARSLGWSAIYLSRRLKGQVSFSLVDVFAIARALGVPVSRFIQRESAVA